MLRTYLCQNISMASKLPSKPILITAISLAVIFILILIVLSRFGQAYDINIASFVAPPPPTQSPQQKQIIVQKITITNPNNENCTEITPDGIIRVHINDCSSKLISANRLNNLRDVFSLLKITSEKNLSSYQTTPVSGAYYTMTIETESGIQTIYIPIISSSKIISEIIPLIERIQQDIPPTPTQPLPYTSPTLTPTTPTNANPTPPISSTPTSPTPIPSQPAQEGNFTCDFSETGKKPANVSGVLCSTPPSPAH